MLQFRPCLLRRRPSWRRTAPRAPCRRRAACAARRAPRHRAAPPAAPRSRRTSRADAGSRSIRDAEVMRLAEHRADAAHLEHQPLERLVAAAQVGGQKAAGLGGEVDEDRARFEQRDRPSVRAVGIDDRRDLVVRADGQEFRLELVAGADVDRDGTVGQAALLEHHVDLVAIGRGPRIHFDHRVASP